MGRKGMNRTLPEKKAKLSEKKRHKKGGRGCKTEVKRGNRSNGKEDGLFGPVEGPRQKRR